MDEEIKFIFEEIREELNRADAKYPPMAERVEGLYTLKAELAELEREVMRVNHEHEKMYAEAIQVAAMSLKFLRDCCSDIDDYKGFRL